MMHFVSALYPSEPKFPDACSLSERFLRCFWLEYPYYTLSAGNVNKHQLSTRRLGLLTEKDLSGKIDGVYCELFHDWHRGADCPCVVRRRMAFVRCRYAERGLPSHERSRATATFTVPRSMCPRILRSHTLDNTPPDTYHTEQRLHVHGSNGREGAERIGPHLCVHVIT